MDATDGYRWFVYVCMLALDGSGVQELADDFIPTRAVAVDSFPQTIHVEAQRSLPCLSLAASVDVGRFPRLIY